MSDERISMPTADDLKLGDFAFSRVAFSERWDWKASVSLARMISAARLSVELVRLLRLARDNDYHSIVAIQARAAIDALLARVEG